MAAGTVHIPWYATVFRGDKLAAALAEIAPLSLRYGATHFEVHRSRDDSYRFLQIVAFDSKIDWESYWYGPDFNAWRADCVSWYQVPVLYTWNDTVIAGGRIDGNGDLVSARAPAEGDTI